MARCWSNFMLARSSPNRKPRKPCKRDHTPRAPRIVSPLCARLSEPSEADSLHTSDITLSSLPMDWKVPLSVSRRKRRSINRPVELHSRAASCFSHTTTNQPLIAAPEFRNIHINHDDTTSVLLPNIHPSFFSRYILPCIHLTTTFTLPFSIECRESSIIWPKLPPKQAHERGAADRLSHLTSSSPHARTRAEATEVRYATVTQ